MHKITFHNIGNADCIRIDLDNGKKLLFDYADMGDPDDSDDQGTSYGQIQFGPVVVPVERLFLCLLHTFRILSHHSRLGTAG